MGGPDGQPGSEDYETLRARVDALQQRLAELEAEASGLQAEHDAADEEIAVLQDRLDDPYRHLREAPLWKRAIISKWTAFVPALLLAGAVVVLPLTSLLWTAVGGIAFLAATIVLRQHVHAGLGEHCSVVGNVFLNILLGAGIAFLWMVTYPAVRVDNPTGTPLSFRLDGGPRVEVPPRDHRTIHLTVGEHTFAFEDASGEAHRRREHVAAGESYVLSLDGLNCYHDYKESDGEGGTHVNQGRFGQTTGTYVPPGGHDARKRGTWLTVSSPGNVHRCRDCGTACDRVD